MYAWLWRILPFGLPGKIAGSLVLAGAAVAALWFVVFPWMDPFVEQTILPWNEGQLEGDFRPDDPPTPTGDPSPTGPANPTGPASPTPAGTEE